MDLQVIPKPQNHRPEQLNPMQEAGNYILMSRDIEARAKREVDEGRRRAVGFKATGCWNNPKELTA